MTTKNDMDTAKDHSKDAVATVVAAFAQRRNVSVDDIVSLATQLMPVFGKPEVATPAIATEPVPSIETAKSAATPAIPLDKAVTNDKVFCLCCGRGFTMLKRHLNAEHGLTEEEYRQLFSLPESMPLVAPNYSERKAAYAKQVGLGKYNRDSNLEEGASAP